MVGPDLESVFYASDLAISPSFETDDTLFVANKTSLFRSTNGGDTWQKVFDYCLGCGNYDPWVVLSPDFASDNTLFTSKVRGGVFRSADGGETWQQVSLGSADAKIPDFVYSLHFPGDSTTFVITEDGLFRRSGF